MRLFIKLWSIFVKDLISSNLFRRKLRTLDLICVTVHFGNVCLFRRYCLMFIVIDAGVQIVRWKMLSSMKNVDVA